MADVNYQDWVGSKEEREDTITLSFARRFAATLDDVESTFANGDPLPPMWHFALFLPDAPMREIGPDGHPKRGGFLPPVALPRRMFAGSQTTHHGPLPIGADVRRISEVTSVEEKCGRSGTLLFVTVDNRTYVGDILAMEERHNIVYRELGAPNPAPVPLAEWPDLPDRAWSHVVTPDAVMLVRYSALTFNGHRIHYDRPYVMEEEGYPGLVVHGPLIASWMAELVRRKTQRAVKYFEFRALAPIFDTAPFRVVAVEGADDTVELWAERVDGQKAQAAKAVLS